MNINKYECRKCNMKFSDDNSYYNHKYKVLIYIYNKVLL